jgi:DNA mismatch repair protein MutL
VLPETLVNRIAAGEVVERPASAVKELVENAIDAGAARIDVVLRDGGRSLIAVTDDGCGMDAAEIALAVERHATSKLADENLSRIATLGFRGEALPSIAAVSRLTLTSRPRGADAAYAIAVEGGAKGKPQPAALSPGTRVEVRDLFFATPARLKFLKQPRTETDHAADVVARLAMAHPAIEFTFAAEQRNPLRFEAAHGDLWDARLARLAAVMGRDFAENALKVEAEREGYRLTGYIGLPTLNRANAQSQYLFVDGRPVRDKLLLGAVRGAYRDLLARDRSPLVALFFAADPGLIDVNVHPAKAEVRFRDAGLVRGLIVGALKHALAAAGHRASTASAASALSAFRGGGSGRHLPQGPGMFEDAARFQAPLGVGLAPQPIAVHPGHAPHEHAAHEQAPAAGLPLGLARAQLHETYIVAETADGIVIVDQHAAHERLVHERLKQAIDSGSVPRQALLIPEVVELPEDAAARLGSRAEDLAEFGLVIESFGAGAVVVREAPAVLAGADIAALVRDLADQLAEDNDPAALQEKLLHVCATRACHNSVRAGCVLNEAEMNALLRQMESTPHAGQCSHGRPTYVELKLADIEKLFGRR